MHYRIVLLTAVLVLSAAGLSAQTAHKNTFTKDKISVVLNTNTTAEELKQDMVDMRENGLLLNVTDIEYGTDGHLKRIAFDVICTGQDVCKASYSTDDVAGAGDIWILRDVSKGSGDEGLCVGKCNQE